VGLFYDKNRLFYLKGKGSMNMQTKEGMMDRLIAGFGIMVYRLLECIDGEKGIRLIPYRVAQQAKIETLMFLERVEINVVRIDQPKQIITLKCLKGGMLMGMNGFFVVLFQGYIKEGLDASVSLTRRLK
jgi:hypothetical protein